MERYWNYARLLATGAPAPSATITVYLTGTLTLASIFSNNLASPTPEANPFTADANGFFKFYAANGRYDVKLSGGGIPTPYTWADIAFGLVNGGFVDEQILADTGILATPSISFSGQPGSGLYIHNQSDAVRFAVNGNLFIEWNLGLALVKHFYELNIRSGIKLTFGDSSDLILARAAAALLQLGADSATPIAQGIKAADGAGTNIAGALVALSSGKSTGTGAGGDVVLRTTPKGSTGAALNSYIDRVAVNGAVKTLVDAALTPILSQVCNAGESVGLVVFYQVRAGEGTNVQTRTGFVTFSVVRNNAGTFTTTTTPSDSSVAQLSTGTLALSWTLSVVVDTVTLNLTADTSLVAATLDITYTVINNSKKTVTYY